MRRRSHPSGRLPSRPSGACPVWRPPASKRHGRAPRALAGAHSSPGAPVGLARRPPSRAKAHDFAATEADGGREICPRRRAHRRSAAAQALPAPRAWTSSATPSCSARAGATMLRRPRPARALVRGELARARRARARRPAGRGGGGRVAARLPPPLREGRRRPLRGLPRASSRTRRRARCSAGSCTTRCSTCTTRDTQLQRVAPERHGRRAVAARAHPAVEGLPAASPAALAGVIGTIVLLAQYFLVLPLFALAREARRAPGAPGLERARAARAARPPCGASTEP